MKTVLLYFNQIYSSETTGQGRFEHGLLNALEKDLEGASSDLEIFLFSVINNKPFQPRVKLSPRYFLFKKSNYLNYIALQLKYLFYGSLICFKYRKHSVGIYARYSPALFAPIVLSWLFNIPLAFRTGPVLQSLKVYRPQTPRILYPIVKSIFLLLASRAKKIFVITETVKNHISELSPKIAKKVVVMPNGADPEQFYPISMDRNTLGFNDSDFIVGYIGFIDDFQGIDVLVRATAEACLNGNDHIKLLVIGDGPSLDKWKSLGTSLNISSNIIWKGRVDHASINSWISVCNVMTLPLSSESIQTRGTSATKLFEYLACDKYVIASRCNDLLFLEKHNIGALVQADSVKSWADAILMYSQKGDKNCSGNARQLVTDYYNFDRIVKTIKDNLFE